MTLAVVLMALKTLELRARRDAFVVFFLGFFLILTHFLYSQSLLVALAMLVSVWGLLTALVLAHMPVGQPGLRQAGLLAGRTALLGAPVMALLFVLFPRVGPLWSVPGDGQSKTGLSNSMRFGSVAEVAQDDSVAFRLRFLDGPPPPPASRYFRGPVLTHFDGTEWQPASVAYGPLPRRNLHTSGTPLRYEMTLEPDRLTTLPLLDAAAAAPVIEGYRVFGLPDLQWRTERPVVERLRFDAVAYPQFRHGPTRRDATLMEALDLPPGYNPRLLAWAAALRREPRYADADARTLAERLLQEIRSGGYSYTLVPGTYGEADDHAAIDEFWFDRKQGFCEHYAAAFVVLMRALDVPARVVTGYQGTDSDPVDGYYVVRQSSAHAWAEYWQPGEGWLRADPTAAVAPERIDRSRRLAPPPGLVADALGSMSPQLLARLRDGWEALNNRWNQWVLSYSRGQQLDLLKRLGIESPDWDDLARLLAAALAALAVVGAAWAWWQQRRIDPWQRQMDRLRRALQAADIDAPPHATPRTLAERVRRRHGAAGEALVALLMALERQRYAQPSAAKPDRGLTRRFIAGARGLR